MATVIIIVIVAVIVVAAVAAIGYTRRKRQLRQRFGPEYDRLVAEHHSSRKAEAELAERQRRVRGLDIKPLDPAAQTRYSEEWAVTQEMFVDSPQGAVGDAQRLTMTVMNERGYPTEQDDQILADLSVDHARVLDHYRVASAIAQRAAEGSASTEDLRQAMIHYRALFQDLLGLPADADEPEAAAQPADAVSPDGTWEPSPADMTPAEAADEEAPAEETPETNSRVTAAETDSANPDPDAIPPEMQQEDDTAARHTG